MKYTILSAKVLDESIITDVLYEFEDGTKVQIPIPHFQPQSVADVVLGIENRAVSESRKLTASAVCKQLLADLQIGVAVDIVKAEAVDVGTIA